MESTLDWVSLSLTPGLGVTGMWRLIDRFETPAAIFSATRKQLLGVNSIRQKQIGGLAGKSVLYERAHLELQRLKKYGGTAICFADERYPEKLKQLPDPPPVIYVKGNLELLRVPGLAIVGSRAATAYGRRVSRSLAGQLAVEGITVISGMALGIDTESHHGALESDGSTIAVLGCGLDVAYPKQNHGLLQTIGEKGLVITEYPLGTPPEGFRFPARNRIIAGLSEGILVVEAARKSGSLITAQIGLDLGREIFAVPGQVDSFKSEGTHWLLQQGAKLVGRVEDILVEFGVGRLRDLQSDTTSSYAHLDEDAVVLLESLDTYPQERDDVIVKSGLSTARATELLLYLELEGLVEVLPGTRICRVG